MWNGVRYHKTNKQTTTKSCNNQKTVGKCFQISNRKQDFIFTLKFDTTKLLLTGESTEQTGRETTPHSTAVLHLLHCLPGVPDTSAISWAFCI